MTQQAFCEGCPQLTTCPCAAVFEAPAPAQHDMQRFSHIPNRQGGRPPYPAKTMVRILKLNWSCNPSDEQME